MTTKQEQRPNPLLQVPRMSPEELDLHLTPEDMESVEDFENAWQAFLINDPGILPQGKAGIRALDLQQQIEHVNKTQDNMQKELEQQLEFFSNKRENLETNYKVAMTHSATVQKKIHGELQKQLDNVAEADVNFSKGAPWEHFLDGLDGVVAKGEPGMYDGLSVVTPGGSKTIKPSERALLLVDNSVGDVKDIQLRAYRIDHALLTAQTKRLQIEVDRYERTTESLEMIGKFLTEHNIWGLLTKNSPSDSRTQLVE
jgi:hypothetical protein